MDVKLQFPDVVAAVAAAERNGSRDMWKVADAVLAAVPMGEDGPNNGSQARLRVMAEELEGVGYTYEPGTLNQMRMTAAAWPRRSRDLRAEFRTYEEARNHQDVLVRLNSILDGKRPSNVPAELAAKIRQRDRVAVNDVRVMLNRPVNLPTRPAPELSREQKLDVAREVMRNPEAMEAAMSDHETRSTVLRATNAWSRSAQDRADRAQRERAPELTDSRDWYQALGRLASARHAVNEALRLMSDIGRLNGEQKAEALRDTAGIEVSTGWLRSFLESGDQSFDDELAALLADGQ